MPVSTLRVGGWSVRFTDRVDGDFGPSSVGVAERRTAIVGTMPVAWLRQVHGASVVIVRSPDEVDRFTGTEADAAITVSSGVALSVVTADCAPIAIVAGQVGAVVHAGWHGLLGGVIEAAVAAVRELADPDLSPQAILGPCIHPRSYEFGADHLSRVAARYGDEVRGRTADGRPALDLPRAIEAALSAVHVPVLLTCNTDTSSPSYFSHRTRADPERQAMFLWRDR